MNFIERNLAAEFDRLKKVSEGVKAPKAPAGEFKKILKEMEQRGIEPKIRKELEK
ncbi:hypothetical protein [Lacrimispora indolis]|uniref:hypothetical protein n=1 Tax=Lacrimispora indolis TaxID=69825 RepID=UPI0004058647|nr:MULTISPECIES: hypothetical protein [Lachnospiraceae]